MWHKGQFNDINSHPPGKDKNIVPYPGREGEYRWERERERERERNRYYTLIPAEKLDIFIWLITKSKCDAKVGLNVGCCKGSKSLMNQILKLLKLDWHCPMGMPQVLSNKLGPCPL